MVTEQNNESGPIQVRNIDYAGSLTHNHAACGDGCAMERLKRARAVKAEALKLLAESEVMEAEAITDLKKLMGIDIESAKEVPAPTPSPGKENSVPNSVIINTVIKKDAQGKIPMGSSKAAILEYLEKATAAGDHWITFTKIQEATGMSRVPTKNGIDALKKEKKISIVQKRNNPAHTDPRVAPRMMDYIQLRS